LQPSPAVGEGEIPARATRRFAAAAGR